jgi:hypothetical protein
MHEVGSDLDDLNKKSIELWANLHKPIPAAPEQQQEPKTQGPFDPKEKVPSRVGEWQTALEEKKVADEQAAAAHGQLLEEGKAMELAYWQNIIATTKLSSQEIKEIAAKIATDKLALQRAGLEGALAAMKNEETAAGTDLQKRLEAEQKYADQVKKIYVDQPKFYEEAQKAILATQQKMKEQERQVDDIALKSHEQLELAALSDEEAKIKEATALHLLSDAQIQRAEQDLENKRYAIEAAAVERRKALIDPSRDPVAYAQVNAELEQLAAQHQTKLTQIERTAINTRMQYEKQFFDGLQSSMATAIAGFVEHTQSLGEAVRGFFKSVMDSIVQIFANIAAKWITQQISQAVLGRTTAIGQISANAAQAGSAAVAATAAIPIVGPELAPAAGAAAFAEAMGYQGLMVARAGYDVPAGLNPITQLHSREVVLPEKLGDVIRGMASRGTTSPAQKRAGPLQLALHPSAMRYSLNDWLQSEVARIAATTRFGR